MSDRPPTSTEPMVLSYGTAPRRWQTRWARRVAIAGIVLAFVAPAIYYAPRCCEFLGCWYCQRQCMKFNPPPSTVVYEQLPFGSAAPAIIPPYMNADNPEVQQLWLGGSEVMPFFEKHPPLEVNRVPICWLRFLQENGGGAGPRDGGVVFCHELVNPKRRPRRHPVGRAIARKESRTMGCDRINAKIPRDTALAADQFVASRQSVAEWRAPHVVAQMKRVAWSGRRSTSV